MIMTATYTKEDKALLKKPLPQDPCKDCGMGSACCGCQKGYDYEEQIRPYKDAGIYEIADSLRTIATLKQEIKDKQQQIKVMNESLPDFCKTEIPDIRGL